MRQSFLEKSTAEMGEDCVASAVFSVVRVEIQSALLIEDALVVDFMRLALLNFFQFSC